MANAWKRETHTTLPIENNMLKSHFEPVFENLQRIYDGIYFNRVGDLVTVFNAAASDQSGNITFHKSHSHLQLSQLSREKKALKDGCSSLCCETREAAGSRWWRGTNS
ncbi:hypothetical protein ACB092_01G311200 [Castanea dentata]